MPTELNTFNFTNRSDLAQDLNDGLANTGNFVNTLPGNDTLEGAGGNFGLNNSGTIETGNGDDTIEASGGSGGSGILNLGTIETDNGNDSIEGNGVDGVEFGIDNENNATIKTGNGNDTIEGTAEAVGILNRSTIETDNGNDIIIGTSTTVGGTIGLFNSGTIETGNGKDELTGVVVSNEFSGFGGGGEIDLGRGNDTISGFGEQTVFGGNGFDTAIFEFDSSAVTFGSGTTPDSTEVIADGITMTFFEVEQFIFSNDTFEVA